MVSAERGQGPHQNSPWWTCPAPRGGGAVWSELARCAATGDYLLHGSRSAGLGVLEPRAPVNFSSDDFSKTAALYATEDPTWAMALIQAAFPGSDTAPSAPGSCRNTMSF